MKTPPPTSPVSRGHVIACGTLCLLAPMVAALGTRAGVWGSMVSSSWGPSAARAEAEAGLVGMGQLAGRDYLVALVPTPDGTRYTIRDRRGGLIASQVSAEEASAFFGGADPRTLTTREGVLPGPGTLMMHADVKE